MDFFISHIVSYLLFYKYVTIFLVAFIAAVIVPIPSGTVLMAASAFASQGYFKIFWVITLSIVGNVLGDNLGYYLAQKYGRQTLSRIGFRKVLESEKFGVVEERFKRHPGLIVFLSRFEVLSTLSVNLLSGLGKISYRKYLFHEVAGTIAQVLIYAYIGYTFGDNLQYVSALMGKILIGIFVLIILIFLFGKKKEVSSIKTNIK